MKLNIKKLWLILATIGVLGFASTAHATYPNPSQKLDIHVSISASKSLEVDTTYYNFGALPISSTVVSASSITVLNDSGGLVETYTIQGASATSVGAGTDWPLAASPGNNQYALAAQFSDPGALQSAWTTDDLTYAAVACDDDIFGNTTHAQAGNGVAYLSRRGLWFRIKTPTAVTDTAQHQATITLAVQ